VLNLDLEGITDLWLKKIDGEARRKTYRSSRFRRVCLPKADGKKRALEIAMVRDRVVQTAVILLLFPDLLGRFPREQVA
jgi:retron-type reverse transcriptase